MANIQWPFQFERLSRGSLDVSAVFDSLSDFITFLSSGPAYVGQIVAVKNDTNFPDVFVVNEDYTYSPIGSGDSGGITSSVLNQAIQDHDTSSLSHDDLRILLTDLIQRMDGFESLGAWAGTFDIFADVPTNISGFNSISTNDFIFVREDENHGNFYSRYFVESIDGSGNITWGFDRVWADTVATADQVTMGDSFTVSQAVGGIPVGTTLQANDNLFGVLKRMMRPVVPPTYVQPTLSLSGSTPYQREIGENLSVTLVPTWTQNDGGAGMAYRLYKNNNPIFMQSIISSHADTAFQLTSATVYRAEVDYGQGNIKNDSEGNPDPNGRIVAGTNVSSNVTYTPIRRAFFGSYAGSEVPNTSALIRALSQSFNNPNNNSQLVANFTAGNRTLVFAYPATLRAATSIVSAALGNIPVSNFTNITVDVEGANGYSPVSYRVYYLTTDLPMGSSDTYTLTI